MYMTLTFDFWYVKGVLCSRDELEFTEDIFDELETILGEAEEKAAPKKRGCRVAKKLRKPKKRVSKVAHK